MKVLIDANVVLDVLLNRQPWVVDSQRIWDANHQRRIEGHLVATSVTNLFYIARKLVGQPLALRGVLDCLAAFEVIPVDGVILGDAAALPGSDYEDNVTIRCAASAGMDCIVTRDPRGFTQSLVPSLTPAELIARLPAVTT
jgi:hypothetical protein